MRLIDADALAKFIDYGHLNNPNEKLYSENDIREMIDMMPTVDSVKHGHWTDRAKSIIGVPTEACSECAEWSIGYEKDYCPNCGAKMDEVEEDG